MRCKKAIANEVKFFRHSYKDFMTCENEKLQSVINALNATNVDRIKKKLESSIQVLYGIPTY